MSLVVALYAIKVYSFPSIRLSHHVTPALLTTNKISKKGKLKTAEDAMLFFTKKNKNNSIKTKNHDESICVKRSSAMSG